MRLNSLAAAAKIALIVLSAQGLGAAAAEVNVIAAVPMTGVIKEIAPQFERETGHKLVTSFVSGLAVKAAIDKGAPFDLAISYTYVIDDLIREGEIVAGPRVDVAYAGLGVGVRAGAPKPDVSTVEAFKRTLLNAKSVAHSDNVASGDRVKAMLVKLGIAEQMRPKLMPLQPDRIYKAVPNGEAEMIVVTISVILEMAGAEFAGPLPAELQFYNEFAAGIGANATQAEAAKTLLKLMTAPAAAAIIKAKGMEPGSFR